MIASFVSFIWVVASFGSPDAAVALADPTVPTEQVGTLLQAQLESQRKHTHLLAQGRRLSLAPSLHYEFYAQRGFKPTWTSLEAVNEGVRLLMAADQEGLAPRDYHVDAILQLKSQIFNGAEIAPDQYLALELLLTDAVAAYAVHLAKGKLKPEWAMPAWNFTERFARKDSLQVLAKLTGVDSLALALEKFKPSSTSYILLKEKLAFYRQLSAQGQWPKFAPDSLKVGKGASHDNVALLRQRLRSEGFLASPSDTTLFDDSLEVALKVFQAQYGVRATGVLDANTFKALNVPMYERINAIRVNLEKCRWMPDSLPADRVVVNIPAFRLYYYRQGQKVWETDVTTGKPENATPIFRTKINAIDINPTWTVPGGITRNEVLPAVQRNPNYLRRNRMTVIDRGGKVVDPATVDWTSYAGGKYTFMQPPGRGNQLGKIKFVCNNQYAIFLHDTPHKSLFKFMERAFSHGCVRVWEPFKLAEHILADTAKWNKTVFDTLVAKGSTRRVPIKGLDVHIVYNTAGADPEGNFFFRKDFYGHDQQVLTLLDQSLEAVLQYEARKKEEERKLAEAKKKAAQEALKLKQEADKASAANGAKKPGGK
jgi:murein L,D-transpeptidase YcbB/YkuD